MPLTINDKDQLVRTANECARLVEENKRLATLNDRLREALEFYADKHTWEPMRNGEEEPIWNDYGDTANMAMGRECLKRPEDEPKKTLQEQADELRRMIERSRPV